MCRCILNSIIIELNKEMLNNKELIHQDFKKINKINIIIEIDLINIISITITITIVILITITIEIIKKEFDNNNNNILKVINKIIDKY